MLVRTRGDNVVCEWRRVSNNMGRHTIGSLWNSGCLYLMAALLMHVCIFGSAFDLVHDTLVLEARISERVKLATALVLLVLATVAVLRIVCTDGLVRNGTGSNKPLRLSAIWRLGFRSATGVVFVSIAFQSIAIMTRSVVSFELRSSALVEFLTLVLGATCIALSFFWHKQT